MERRAELTQVSTVGTLTKKDTYPHYCNHRYVEVKRKDEIGRACKVCGMRIER